ncbi:NAD(P)H-hydrate dehydratase [Alicyclobacillus cycloheptanicus]|uniref:Bifunctional NAD(P)H-hydrate repair enzyme n=1 Tax=Alicyclobacillus cycloheptanicus TaxID=1457 RepID=A0ABT9XID4_9BACL|nr:NAD(P)H-hydrate dehydratase [Alicyclobacillus cycloheptanicus]MDQ0190074.1 NAD(P)H-hydrate epimerase [Alicyclobacillus cycloheptanicus]WDM02052.1 NAD(P)H-hydrate dehydratase [Alicyclobacillus cycloheptanicus]
MVLVTSEQMREFDKRTISTLRVPGIVLMDHAGKALAEAALAKRPRCVVALCGKGNNGGDGWVAARWLRHQGVNQVQVVSTVDVSELTGDARTAATSAIAAGVPHQVYAPGQPLPPADVYLDAILGTGAARPLSGQLADLVSALEAVVAASGAWVIAADVPTGVNATTGEVAGPAVRAQQTIAMAAQKLGTAITPGCLYAGDVVVADVGIGIEPSAELAAFTTAADVRAALPHRGPQTHKGTYGRVGVLVGEMTGAAVLAGLGAARAGAGLVMLAGEERVQGAPLEFVQRLFRDDMASVFAQSQALVIGPGLGDGGGLPERTARNLLAHWEKPGVLDADGLRLLRQNGALQRLPEGQWVLTPHPKECAALLETSTEAVQARRLEAATRLARETGGVVILKGYRSIIAHPDGRVRVNATGNAALATAGTGDVLAGIVGGLLAQGADSFLAACAGAFLHGAAGELAGERLTLVSTLASDVVDAIPDAIGKAFHADLEEQ